MGHRREVELNVALVIRPWTECDQAYPAKLRSPRQDLGEGGSYLVDPGDDCRDALVHVTCHRTRCVEHNHRIISARRWPLLLGMNGRPSAKKEKHGGVDSKTSSLVVMRDHTQA
jgi:hypothetical protein